MAPENLYLLLEYPGCNYDVQPQIRQKMALFLTYNKKRGLKGRLTCFLSKASCMASLTQGIWECLEALHYFGILSSFTYSIWRKSPTQDSSMRDRKMKELSRSQELASLFQVPLQRTCWLLMVMGARKQHHQVLLFLWQSIWPQTNCNLSGSCIFHLEYVGAGLDDYIPSALISYQHHYFDYCSELSHPPGTLDAGNKKWTGSQEPCFLSGWWSDNGHWASTSSSVMQFSEEKARHVPCPEFLKII